jgi:hypothetical protein
LAHKIGLNENVKLHELYEISEDFLNFIPKPILGFLFLYPDTKGNTILLPELKIGAKSPEADFLAKVFFMEQVPELGNACGTIGLIHSLINIHLLGKQEILGGHYFYFLL